MRATVAAARGLRTTGSDHQLFPQQLGRESARTSDAGRIVASTTGVRSATRNSFAYAEKRVVARHLAPANETATGGTRTLNLRFTKQPDEIVTLDAGHSCDACAEGAGRSAGNALDASAPTPAIAIDDVELAAVVAAWPAMPAAIRRAVMALVGSVTAVAETNTLADGHGNGGFGDGDAGDADDDAGGER